MAKSRPDNLPPTHNHTAPLSPEELDELFAVLDVLLLRRACDNTLAISERWPRGRGHDVARAVRWLNERGGYCDCEVVFNVAPRVASEPVE